MELFYIPGMTLAEVEKKVILYAFRFHRGNQTKTAQSLGISSKTIYSKLKEYGEKLENEKAEHSGNKNDGDRKPGEAGDANPIPGNLQTTSR